MQENPNEFRIELGGWGTLAADATQVRHTVFVLEQGVSVEDEMDDRDVVCVHAVAYGPNGTAVGTGRLLPDGHIGRMAVLSEYRGRGVGALILNALIDAARRNGHLEVALAAQVHAKNFYAANGFVAEGPVFLDAGIDHVNMRRVLTA